METTLVLGKRYDIKLVVLMGWTEGDGSGSDGYNLSDYFDRHGVYLGPDDYGIEPIVEPIPEVPTGPWDNQCEECENFFIGTVPDGGGFGWSDGWGYGGYETIEAAIEALRNFHAQDGRPDVVVRYAILDRDGTAVQELKLDENGRDTDDESEE